MDDFQSLVPNNIQQYFELSTTNTTVIVLQKRRQAYICKKKFPELWRQENL